MKHKSIRICTILAALALLLSAAYQPGLAMRFGPALDAPASERAIPAGFGSSLAAPVGPPGLSFEYLRTIGITDVPYNTGEGGDDYLNDPYGIDIDANGNLYVAETEGMRVLRFDSFQQADLILGAAGIYSEDADRFMWPSDVLIEGDGDFWVVDETRLLRFNRDGESQTVFLSGGCEAGLFCTPVGLAIDNIGRLYVSDSTLNVVQVFMLDVSGNPIYWATIGIPGEAGDDNAHFNAPGYIDTDSSGALYVTDSGNNRIQKCAYTFTPDPYPYPDPGGTGSGGSWSWSCSTFHGTGEAGEGEDQLSGPTSVTAFGPHLFIVDSGNWRVKFCNLYTAWCSTLIADVENPVDVAVSMDFKVFVSTSIPSYTVKQYTWEGEFLDDYAGTYGMPYATAPDKIYGPGGLAVDRPGNVYVGETRGNRYVKYDAKGNLVGSVGTPGINTTFKGRLIGNPGLGEGGLLYLPDTNRHCVKIYNTSLDYQNQTIGVCNSPGNSDVKFRNPAGVAVSPLNGNIYVVDMGNHKIKGFTGSLSPLGSLGGSASGYGAGDYQFSGPAGIAIDKDGYIYVADSGNHRVQKYDSSGVYQYTIGITGTCDWASNALCGPRGVATDMLSRVYIVDTYNNRVQVFSSTGVYLTTINTSDGNWNYLTGVAVAPNGTVYVTETFRHRIQVFVRSVP